MKRMVDKKEIKELSNSFYSGQSRGFSQGINLHLFMVSGFMEFADGAGSICDGISITIPPQIVAMPFKVDENASYPDYAEGFYAKYSDYQIDSKSVLLAYVNIINDESNVLYFATIQLSDDAELYVNINAQDDVSDMLSSDLVADFTLFFTDLTTNKTLVLQA